MNILCKIGFHEWFYYDEFGSFDSDRRICKKCGLIQTAIMNREVYGNAVYTRMDGRTWVASNEEKKKILNLALQIKKYEAEIKRLVERDRERNHWMKILHDSSPELEGHATQLSFMTQTLITKYKKKIDEFSVVTHEERNEK